MADSVDEIVLSERLFLHDISSPLMVAHGNASIMLEKLKADFPSAPQDQIVDRLERIYSALEKATKILNERRDFIKSHLTKKP